ncbi:Glyoxylate/succinic semialdehyde reductase 2 [Colletotrichum fructicola]|nr:Glyoxylate/succinic semialdehyde reductase 2 [Colletotrichum fructicola]
MTTTSVPSTPHPRLGWIGLGSMGIGMAVNLQKHLAQNGAPSLQYHNRTMSRGEPLESIGGIPRPEIKHLLTNSDIIFMSLSDDAALESMLDAILGNVAPENLAEKIVVDTSTVHPLSSAKARDRLLERRAKFIAAPVFVNAINPFIVGVMGRGVIRLGEDVQKSSMMKTAGNFVTAGMMELVAEAHVFAEKTGLGSEAMEALIEQQYGPLALSMSKRLTTGAYLPGKGQRPWSDLGLALKDVGHGIDCAKKSGARLEVAEVALKHLKEAKEFSDAQGRPLDSSSMYGVLRKEAGLSFETDFVKKRDGSVSDA